jgi:DNA-binding Lrp family transcriptional regulator
MGKMDEIDANIISALKKDSRASFVTMGKDLGLTEGAVRRRVAKLKAAGTIRRFTIDTTSGVSAIIMIGTSSHSPTSKVAEAIEKLGVDRVYEVSGNYDIICFAEGSSLQEINATVEAIRKLPGVTDTSTTLVLK